MAEISKSREVTTVYIALVKWLRNPCRFVEFIIAALAVARITGLLIERDADGHSALLSTPLDTFATAALLGGALLCGYGLDSRKRAFACFTALVTYLCFACVPALRICSPTDACFIALFATTFACQLQTTVGASAPIPGTRRRLILAIALVAGCLPNHLTLLNLAPSGTVFDPAVFNFDQHLGVHLHTLASIALSAVPPLELVVSLIYGAVPLLVALFDMFALQDNRRLSMTARFILSAAIGFVFYHICPVVGPPFYPPAEVLRGLSSDFLFPQGSVDFHVSAPTNCMPSLHSTWALLFLLSLDKIKNRIARAGFLVAGVLSLFGALTVGGHWPLDMAVSVPFALTLNMIFEARWRSIRSGVLNVVIFSLWMVALRNYAFTSISTIDAWLLILATILIPLAGFRFLDVLLQPDPEHLRYADEDPGYLTRRIIRGVSRAEVR